MRTRRNLRLRHERERVTCDRCGFSYYDGELVTQDGLEVCKWCWDESSYQGPTGFGNSAFTPATPHEAGQEASGGVIIGDSIALGLGPYLLSGSGPWTNSGVGSETSAMVWARWSAGVLVHNPVRVVILCGINDVGLSVLGTTTQANLASMMASAQLNHIDPIILTVGPHDVWGDVEYWSPIQQGNTLALNVWIAANAPGYGATIVDMYTWGVDPAHDGYVNPLLYADYAHPNATGYGQLAALVG